MLARRLLPALALLLTLAVAVVAGPAGAVPPLVDPDWLAGKLGTPGLVVLDLVPKPADYQRGHIPGAVHTDYVLDGWRVEKNGIPGMVNDVPALERLIGGLGIGNDSSIVLVPAGAGVSDIGIATRLYWTFKLLGHDAVSILDGGMVRWTAERQGALDAGAVAPKPATFTATYRPELLATKADVVQALADHGAALIDHRIADQYQGISRSGVAKRAGTLPGAVNVPDATLIAERGGRMRDAAALRGRFQAAGVAAEAPQINFCNTGHSASVGWFVAHALLGNTQARLYDGSMAEWTVDPDAPVQATAAAR